MCAVGFLGERNVVGLLGSGSLLAGAHVDVQITGTAHVHLSSHFAVLDGQLTCGNIEHIGAGIDGYIVGAVLHFVAGDRRHAVLNNVLDIGHIGRRSDLRGGAAVLRGGVLLGAAAAGGQEHECRKYGA